MLLIKPSDLPQIIMKQNIIDYIYCITTYYQKGINESLFQINAHDKNLPKI